MNPFPRWPAFALCFLFALAASAADTVSETTTSAATDPEPWSHAVLLDRSADDDLRAEHLDRLESWARRGSRYSRYVLGTLYRLGRDHPARLVREDYDKAAGLLGHAALAGELYAMAGMAELELTAGRPMDGMMWAQAFVTFGDRFHGLGNRSSRGYEAWLIQRLEDAMAVGARVADAREIGENYAAFIQQYGERIAQAMAAGDAGYCASVELCDSGSGRMEITRSGSGPMLGQNVSWRLRQTPSGPAFALFLLAVDGNGKIKTDLTIDSAPDSKAARALVRNLRTTRFEKSDRDAPLRWTLLPFYFDDGSTVLCQGNACR